MGSTARVWSRFWTEPNRSPIALKRYFGQHQTESRTICSPASQNAQYRAQPPPRPGLHEISASANQTWSRSVRACSLHLTSACVIGCCQNLETPLVPELTPSMWGLHDPDYWLWPKSHSRSHVHVLVDSTAVPGSYALSEGNRLVARPEAIRMPPSISSRSHSNTSPRASLVISGYSQSRSQDGPLGATQRCASHALFIQRS
jgi:hypothetical protein